MNALRRRLKSRPDLCRTLPFLIFLGLTMCQAIPGETVRFWVYAGKTVVGAGLAWVVWPLVSEMRWRVSIDAIWIGVAVAVAWVGLDSLYPKFVKGGPVWNPISAFPDTAALAWTFVLIRLAGSTLVVPLLEEVFYRSFLYRWIATPDFQSVRLDEMKPKAFIATAVVFGAAHGEWLAGILCGLAYQWLTIRKGRLGDAMTAHAVTNFLLGVWIVWQGDWRFWS